MRVGRYEIVRELGRGGMARVHLARQLDLDRYAALKELGSLHREDAEMAARFVRESRLAGALNHPSIVTVLDFFEHDGTPYIAMEYVARGSLRPWVGRLTVSQVGGVLESVLAGLAHAHAGSVVHRDLKPENLMVTDDGHVKITDFGIAKALIDSETIAFRTATGATIGTPAYMSPEQAMGETVGPWTDLYATGVIAYELLCGSVPFGNREPMAILLAHCQEAPVPLSKRAPDVPAPIAAWVETLLAKSAADRPPSASAAWDELEEHLLDCAGARWRRSARLEGEPGTERPTGRPITPAQFPSEVWETYETPATAEAALGPAGAPDEVGATQGETGPPPAAAPRSETGPPAAPHAASPPAPHDASPPASPSAPSDASPGASSPAPSPPAPQDSRPAPSDASPGASAPAPRPLGDAAAPTEPLVRPPRSPGPSRRRRRGLLIGAGLAAVAGVAAVLAVALPGEQESPPTPPVSTDDVATDGPVPLGTDWIRAVHVVSYEPEGLANPGFVDAVRRAKAAGATHIVVRPMVVTDSLESAEIQEEPDGPTNEALAVGLEAIQREGVKAIIQPYLEPGGEYPGVYAPSDTGDFFDAWRERVEAWADIAHAHTADGFVVGTVFSQLDGPEYTEQWTALLNDTRTRCNCRVTYSAEDVEGAERVEFWGAADYIGINSAAPLTDEPTNDVDTLTRAWDPPKELMQALNARWKKPVYITDLGYQSMENQAAEPAFEATGEPSEEAQAALYEAAFRAFQGTKWFSGIGWYELNGDGGQPEEGDTAFAGRQAEEVLRAWQTAE